LHIICNLTIFILRHQNSSGNSKDIRHPLLGYVTQVNNIDLGYADMRKVEKLLLAIFFGVEISAKDAKFI
jgi:hypothetical protein